MFSHIIENQRKFFRTGETKPLAFRKAQLLRLRKFIEDNREVLGEAVWKDLRRRHEVTEALEFGVCIQEIDYFIKNLDEWAKPTYVEKTMATVLDKPVIERDPKGVTLVMAPWNYPISLIILPVIATIGAGNTVVVKPSEMSENVAAAFEKLVPKYFDAKYFAIVNGGIPETTDLLKERFDHILYTGSPPVGKIVMTAAAKHLTPSTLELGGKSPVVIEDDADIDITAKRLAWGKWLNCGQTCLAPDYVLVNRTVKSKLVTALRKYVNEFYGEDVKASKDYPRVINTRQFDRLSKLLDETKGSTLIGGERDRNDLFIHPTVLDVEKDDAFMDDEIFGPILPIVTVNSLTESIEFIAKGEKPLAAYIFTKNEAKVKRLVAETSSGGVTVNDVILHITVDTLPFGGIGVSGMGRYRGKFGFDTFTHEKAVLHRGFFGESLQEARYPPMNQQKLDKLRSVSGKRISLDYPSWGTWPMVIASFVLGMAVQFILRAATA